MEIYNLSKNVLSDLNVFLDQISDEEYSMPIKIISGSSIGQHTRHIIDCFLCLMKQVETGEIDYELRERNSVIENKTSVAVLVLEEVKNWLSSLNGDKSLNLSVNYGDNESSIKVFSNLKREIVHNIEHTIHHLAIIKIAITNTCSNIALPENFGVAPSTIRYRNNNAVIELS